MSEIYIYKWNKRCRYNSPTTEARDINLDGF